MTSFVPLRGVSQRRVVARAILVATTVAAVAGCIQMPTERRDAVDLRGQLALRLQDPNTQVAAWRVFVDDIDMGFLSDYVTPSADRQLRLLPGNHVLRIETPAGPVVNERIFIGDGMTRTFTVPPR